MAQCIARGFVADDERFFSEAQVPKLSAAQQELAYLLTHGYPMKPAMTFVGNHHQLTVRQALAITRATASQQDLAVRGAKQLQAGELRGNTLYVDGFNLIITLEVSLADGMLFLCQDGCVRDLAELRGTYRVIAQTPQAVALISKAAQSLYVGKVVFYLDRPVSNSGRLKQCIHGESWPVPVEVEIVPNPDALLKKLPCVATGDSIILNECESWFNLAAYILAQNNMRPQLTHLLELCASNNCQPL